MLQLLEKMTIGDGAIYSVFGFVFVFAGITLLVLIFMLFGLVMKKINAYGEKKRNRAAAQPETQTPVPAEDSDVSSEELAVITAAIAAYYEGERVKCDFVVRRIKRK